MHQEGLTVFYDHTCEQKSLKKKQKIQVCVHSENFALNFCTDQTVVKP